MASIPRGTLYVGVTADLTQRVWQHKAGQSDAFTKRYGVKLLVWYEQHETMEHAITREKAIKQWRREWKLNLVEQGNREWRDLYLELLWVKGVCFGGSENGSRPSPG